jgi:hypothetical protein
MTWTTRAAVAATLDVTGTTGAFVARTAVLAELLGTDLEADTDSKSQGDQED